MTVRAAAAGLPTVSVAMCTYNAGRFLKEQLASLANQTRPPDQVVVCDDGSSDGTAEQAERFAKQAGFPVCVVRNVENLGYRRNFAKAVGLCTGEVIALCDQDDVWYPQKLERLAELFAAHPEAGGIFSDGDLIDTESRPLPGTLWGSFDFQKKDRERIGGGDGVRVVLRRNVVTGMALAIRREWRSTLQSMPDHWPHDFWLALMLADQNALRACPERLVAYRVHGNQQIGVPITRAEKLRYVRAHGLSGYLRLSRERNAREYEKDALQFESLIGAARAGVALPPGETHGGHPNSDTPLASRWWIPLAEAKANHMRRGVLQLQQCRASRWLQALYHWKSYRDYAPTGMAALLRDVLL